MQEGGIFTAKLSFVCAVRPTTRMIVQKASYNITPQPSDYPLSPFKMKFEPPLLHPNSQCFYQRAYLIS
jgi:hypothetical protein